MHRRTAPSRLATGSWTGISSTSGATGKMKGCDAMAAKNAKNDTDNCWLRYCILGFCLGLRPSCLVRERCLCRVPSPRPFRRKNVCREPRRNVSPRVAPACAGCQCCDLRPRSGISGGTIPCLLTGAAVTTNSAQITATNQGRKASSPVSARRQMTPTICTLPSQTRFPVRPQAARPLGRPQNFQSTAVKRYPQDWAGPTSQRRHRRYEP